MEGQKEKKKENLLDTTLVGDQLRAVSVLETHVWTYTS